MKAVILAGGLGTRLAEETIDRPKPMVEIGGKPILWHIMKIYSSHGINDFIVCCGYKSHLIKDYFVNYSLRQSDVSVDVQNNEIKIHPSELEPWNIVLAETGEGSMTGGRLLSVKKYIEDDKDFCFTYGDGVGNPNITSAIKFHRSHKKLATVTTAFAPGRFGNLKLEGDLVTRFHEKPKGDGAMINAGYFVLSPKVLDYIADYATTWENEPLMNLAKDNQLMAFKHHGFWQPMDTLPDKNLLEKLWDSGEAPWKIWS